MSTIWELDFYSRPVLDENSKKQWEVLICESPATIQADVDASFRYSEFCANTEVNSIWLRDAILKAIAQAPQPPDRIRFFRRQMNNMITRACEDAGLAVHASRRTLVLNRWLSQRMEDYYPTLPNYQAATNSSVAMPPPQPQPLPDALIGERWAFVSLEAQAFADMPEWDIGFQEAFPLNLFGLDPTTPIPGLIIFSSRALPLAAWMSGLELAFLRFNPEPPQLVLETGASESWILANLSTAALQKEAKAFAAAKQQAQHIHFIAVQSSPEAESFAGFWLMQEMVLP